MFIIFLIVLNLGLLITGNAHWDIVFAPPLISRYVKNGSFTTTMSFPRGMGSPPVVEVHGYKTPEIIEVRRDPEATQKIKNARISQRAGLLLTGLGLSGLIFGYLYNWY